MQWILILEEDCPELIYIRGSIFIAADALSILDIIDTPNTVKNHIESAKEHCGLEMKTFHTLLIIKL